MDLQQSLTIVDCPEGDERAITRWQAKIAKAFPPLRIQPKAGVDFHGTLRTAGAHDLQVTDIAASAHSVERAPSGLDSRSHNFYKISLQVAGRGRFAQGDRQITLAPGTIAIYDTARPYTLTFDADYRFIVAMFPKQALGLPVGLAGELTARPLAGNTGTGAIVAAYMSSLARNLEGLSRPMGNRIARIGLDLLATLVCQQLDEAPPEGIANRRSLLTEICVYTNARLRDADLSPQTIADAMFISTRHLHTVFKASGTSVAQWIKSRRLEECRRDLCDPILADLPVRDIAVKWGLPDPAYFARVFREAYGMTPAEWRKQSLHSAVR